MVGRGLKSGGGRSDGRNGEVFEGLNDPRRLLCQQHTLPDILVIAWCTVLCGGDTCTDMVLFSLAKRVFLESFLKLENRIPSHDTLSRVFRLLDPEEFHKRDRRVTFPPELQDGTIEGLGPNGSGGQVHPPAESDSI